MKGHKQAVAQWRNPPVGEPQNSGDRTGVSSPVKTGPSTRIYYAPIMQCPHFPTPQHISIASVAWMSKDFMPRRIQSPATALMSLPKTQRIAGGPCQSSQSPNPPAYRWYSRYAPPLCLWAWTENIKPPHREAPFSAAGQEKRVVFNPARQHDGQPPSPEPVHVFL